MFKAVSNITSAYGSGAPISGVPSVVEKYEDFLDNIDKNLAKAMTSVANRYQSDLRKLAQSKGWGPEADSVRVEVDKSSMELVISGNASMEYGTGPSSPKPVMRAAVARVDDLGEMISRELQKGMS